MTSKNPKAKVLVSRNAVVTDKEKILNLYSKVSRNIGGIARTEQEITSGYVQDFMQKSAEHGIQLVIINPLEKNKLLAEIHCYKLEPKVFNHVLSELTIVVDPNYQRMGIGEQIFNSLLHIVKTKMKNILRIELIARESNTHAIKFYEKIGFRTEGKLEKRICTVKGELESDIPMAWFNKNYHKVKKQLL